MSYSTYSWFGIALAILVTRPGDLKTLFFSAIIAMYFSRYPNQDGENNARMLTKEVVSFYLTLIVIFGAITVIFALNLFTIREQPMFLRITLALIAGLVYTLVGMRCSQWGFTHSILGMLTAVACLGISGIPGNYLTSALLGYAGHLVLELLGQQDIQIFFPFPIRISLGLLKPLGKAESIIRWGCPIFTVIYAVTLIPTGVFTTIGETLQKMW